MSEGYVNLFVNEDTSGKKPHFKGYLKIDGVDHEFALWPAKDGKKGFSGKYKVREARAIQTKDTDAAYAQVAAALKPAQTLDDEIPF